MGSDATSTHPGVDLASARLGVLGGSGLYSMDGLEDQREITVETPFGTPSDSLRLGRIGDLEVVFLARHGRHHTLTPTEVPYRANLWALRSLGVRWILSVSAVGSLQEEARPLDMLVPGTPCKDIWEAFNAFMRKHGRPEEARLYCHGQGYDLVERPLIRSDEPWTIQKDTNIVVHPTYPYGGYLNWLCDNYIIGGNGPGDRIHQFPEEIIEIDV